MADESDNEIMSDSSIDDVDNDDVEVDSIYDSQNSSVDSDTCNFASPTQRYVDPNPTRCFEDFFTVAILDEILTNTNVRIATQAEKYKNKTATVDKAMYNELSALIGILIFSGAKGDNDVTTKEMFSSKYGPALYRAAMSERRFCFLLRCLRFDDHATREQRKENDKFAPIRKVWDLFIAQCKSGYTPGAHITIDEQLLGFRGRCPFRMYICNKPARYGIKIIMICDVETKYMLRAMPYLGTHTKPPQDKKKTKFVQLMSTMHYQPVIEASGKPEVVIC
ncbi:piggyBac transposable element-derived protein 4-like [Macrobrachium rosenbergii]|uniref:piggyBac transposable element-derived protein 4-like n=1 Tax=Macrobrachium rosenbergii TaxID=79674 RepID=UPI0034D45899